MSSLPSSWRVDFGEKSVGCVAVLNHEGYPTFYPVGDDSFWSHPQFNDIHAIQWDPSLENNEDCVEYNAYTFGRNRTWNECNFSDSFRNLFIEKWDAAHLAQLQADWDGDNVINDDGSAAESAEEKIARLGARPTSYTSP